MNKADDDQQHRQKQQFNCFNSHTKQPFELSYYIGGLVSRANCSVSAFIVMLVYLDRVGQRCKHLQVTELNVHRIVLAALLAAAKWVDDEVYRNAHFASIGGVDVHELKHLEWTFNEAADWALFVSADGYKTCENGLLEQWTRTNAQCERVVIPAAHPSVSRE